MQSEKVWLPDQELGYVVGTIVGDGKKTGFVKIRTATGKELEIQRKDAEPLYDIQPVDDLIKLDTITEAIILEIIKQRYLKDIIYTYIGPIVISVNPFCALPQYDESTIPLYAKGLPRDSLPPHLYSIAHDAYKAMESGQSQSIVISGESGAGKTEATKIILKYLCEVSGKDSTATTNLAKAVLATNPILEAFGNAKTLRNNNSSRFGKFIRILFDRHGSISGATINNYLLENTRIIFQAPEERNYHIFYQLIKGASEAQKKEFSLLEPKDYHYLSNGDLKSPGMDDGALFSTTIEAFKILDFSEDEISQIFSVVSAVLALGNITFVGDDAVEIKNKDALTIACKLLGVDVFVLDQSLTKRYFGGGGRSSSYTIPLDKTQAVENRDALAKDLYSKLFDYLVTRLNKSLTGDNNPSAIFIGVLDIYGFEIFDKNSLEQFCINFTNERLHLQFNHHMFKAEQEEYEKENVPWEKITFQDNSGCIDLIEKPGGILAALDEECRLPKGNDDAFLNKITQKHKSNVWFGINPRMPSVFAIKHFAGTVNYTVTSFLTKNKNTLNADVTRAMATSTTVLIAMHYAKDDSEDSKKNFAKRTPVRRETTNANKTTVTQKFRKELADLLKLLEESQRHYIRCIKPNELKVEKNFQPSKVLAQLKSNGVMETVRLRKAGYTLKTPPETFYLRYVFLGIESVSKVPNFLQKYTTQDLWAMGKTKVFLRAALIEKLEDDRQNKLRDKVTSIQRFIRRYNQMAQYRLLLDSWKRKKEEEERKRLEEENRKRLLEEERLRKIEEERKRKEEEELRKQQELERKKQAEEEAKRKQLETLQKQQAEREKKIEEQQLEKDRLEKQRKEEELFRREFPTQKSRERILLAQKNQNSFTSDKISDLPKSPSRIQVMEKKQLFELARKPPSPAQPKTPNPVVPQFTRSPTISPVAIGQRQNHFSALKSIWERKPPPGVSVPNTTPPSSPSIPSLSLSSPRPDLMDEKPDTPRPFSPRDKKLGFGSMSHQPEIGSRRLFPRKMDLDVSFEEEKNEGRVRRDEERRKQEEQRLRAEEEKRQKEEQLRKMEEEERLLKEEKERLRLEEINLRMEEERILKEVELFRKQEEEREAARIAERNRRLEEERLRKLKEEQEMKRKEEERMRQVEEDRMKRGAEWKRLNSPKDATARVEPVTKQQPPPKKQENPVAKAKEDQKIMQDLQNWQVQADKANEELNKSDEFRNMFNSIDFDFSDTSEFNDNVRKRLSDWSMLSNAIKPKSEPVEEPNFDEEINYPTTYKRPTKESDELKDMVNEIQRISQSYSKKRTISKNSNPLAKYTSDEFKKSPTPISRVQDTLTSNNNSPLRYEQPNNDRTWPSTRRVRGTQNSPRLQHSLTSNPIDDNNQAPLPFYMHGVQKGSTRQSTRQVGRLPRFSGRVSQSFNTESEESEESSEVDPVDELRLNATELENMMANFSSTRSGSTTTSESEEENEPLPTIRSRFTPNKTHLRSLVESQSKFKSPARTFQNTEFPPQVEQASNPPQIAQPPTLPQIDPNIPDTGKGTIRNEYIDSLLESATQEDLDSMLSLLENYETEPVETDYNKFDEDPFNPEPADVSSFRRDPNDFTNEVVPQETGVSDEQLYNNFSPEEINEAFAELGLDDFDNWDNENDDIQHKVTSTMHYSDEDFYKHASAILADINSKNPQ